MIQKNYTLNRSGTLNGLMVVSAHVPRTLTPVIKKVKTLPQIMMEDFLERQKIYDKINRPFQKVKESESLNVPSKFKVVVQEAKLQLMTSSMKQSQFRKRENIKQIVEKMRQEKMKKRSKAKPVQEHKQLEIWILIVTIIPIVFIIILIELFD